MSDDDLKKNNESGEEEPEGPSFEYSKKKSTKLGEKKKEGSYVYDDKKKAWKDAPADDDEKDGVETSAEVEIYKKQWVDEKKYHGDSTTHHSSSPYQSTHYEYGTGYTKADVSSDLSIDLEKKEISLKVIDAELKGSLAHAEAESSFDIGSWIAGLLSGLLSFPNPPAIPGIGGGGPFAARIADPTSHGSPLAPGSGSPNVLIGNMPAWRALGDFHACPIVKGIVPDVGGMVLKGAMTVLINNLPAARAGDLVVEIPGGPNPIAMGCPTVMIGEAGSGGSSGGSGLKAKGSAEADVGVVEATLDVGGEFTDKAKGLGAKASAFVALAKGTLSGELEIPIPFAGTLTLGAEVEGSVLSAGAEAEASAMWTQEEGFKAKVGGKAGVGLGGAGIGFSIGFK